MGEKQGTQVLASRRELRDRNPFFLHSWLMNVLSTRSGCVPLVLTSALVLLSGCASGEGGGGPNEGENSPPGSGGGPQTSGDGGDGSAAVGGGGGASLDGSGGLQTGGGDPGGGGGGGGLASTGGDSAAGGDAGTGGNAGTGGVPGAGGAPPSGDCEALVTDPEINWRESTLQTDQEIVACLASTLGRPVGYGENTRGGFDPAGGSKLVVITKGAATSVEQQLLEAIDGEEHSWIVFDKDDFADESEVAMYRNNCSDPGVLSTLGFSEAECLDHQIWCSAQNFSGAECLDQYFNTALNNQDLTIRNPVIGSNKTIDGRMSRAHFLFSGFAIGSDSSGEPVITSSNVILTHLEFRGAGHTEDHYLDPDMVRSTGASHDIWIHKNTFNLTGDSAFDVKVGAYDITMSFNRVENVMRAALHGSSDSRIINEQITTTMHHNAFVTTDALYETFGNTARRVPLIRRGTSHMWNNLFMNYRKDIVSARVGAHLYWEDNAVVINAVHQEKETVADSLSELEAQLVRDFSDANYRADGIYLWFSDATCSLEESTKTPLALMGGTVSDLASDYSLESQTMMNNLQMEAGQELIDYISKTAGKYAQEAFNSPLAPTIDEVLSTSRVGCQ